MEGDIAFGAVDREANKLLGMLFIPGYRLAYFSWSSMAMQLQSSLFFNSDNLAY